MIAYELFATRLLDRDFLEPEASAGLFVAACVFCLHLIARGSRHSGAAALAASPAPAGFLAFPKCPLGLLCQRPREVGKHSAL